MYVSIMYVLIMYVSICESVFYGVVTMKKFRFGIIFASVLFLTVLSSVFAEDDDSSKRQLFSGNNYAGIVIYEFPNQEDRYMVSIDPYLWSYNKKLNSFRNNFGNGIFSLPGGSKVKKLKKDKSGLIVYDVYMPSERDLIKMQRKKK
ncbi:MAG: hypothetical protein Ta2G_20020 [Termitinemataceae bacterium]|nr:MAG: hypothetical protein Ta2G_20020 [Termitinemataceae bacterium]